MCGSKDGRKIKTGGDVLSQSFVGSFLITTLQHGVRINSPQDEWAAVIVLPHISIKSHQKLCEPLLTSKSTSSEAYHHHDSPARQHDALVRPVILAVRHVKFLLEMFHQRNALPARNAALVRQRI
jgi:hypothetical protein